MPVKARPAPVAVANWNSCFVGGHVGGLWGEKKAYDEDALSGTLGQFRGDNAPASVVGGVQVGCDWQFGKWVWGVQGDYGWTDANASNVDLLDNFYRNHSSIESLASVTGRVGYTWDKLLLFVRGGGAWVRDEYQVTVNSTGLLVASAKETRSGWTVGAGAEMLLNNNWSGFFEYNYYDFGKRGVDLIDTSGVLFSRAGIEQVVHTFKIGMNYRWGVGNMWTGGKW